MPDRRPRVLPEFPNLDRLRAEARTLQRGLRAGDQESRALAEAYAPPGRVLDLDQVSLATAQWLLARSYGFASWPELKHQLQTVATFTRAPEPAGTEPDEADRPALVDHLLRLAVLNYTRDRGRTFGQARDLLARRPDLATADLFTMAICGRAEDLRQALARDSAAANRQGGPYDWPALLYLTSGRISDGPSAVGAARALLDAGADPNAGYLWHGLRSPFTALTCALGGGEQDQPLHPAAIELARMLLDAGA
ncbi:MAG: ankyrin repeat domain-containing protein, partial [Microlunatus sp.]|nr:ankyrin repeat domain-containing protein [Microlunatus sp.]